MRYKILHPDVRKRPSTVVTSDGKVVWASPALAFWVGQDVGRMIHEYRRRGASWNLVGPEFNPPTLLQLIEWKDALR